eukprot:10949479-Heterocapsa_arctica.AAC.1
MPNTGARRASTDAENTGARRAQLRVQAKGFESGATPSPPERPHAQRWHVRRGANGNQAYWQ